MKFAICYSGQTRFPEKRFKGSHKQFIFDVLTKYGSIDYFLHFWNSPGETCREGEIPILHKDNELTAYAKDLLDLIKPKTYLFENQKDQNKMISMYESIYFANQLKYQHELINGFKYDAVLRMRADFDFNHELPEYVLVELDKIHVRDAFGEDGINDQFCITNSDLMDIYSDCFTNLDLNLIGHPEKALRKYFIKIGINDKVKLLPNTLFWF